MFGLGLSPSPRLWRAALQSLYLRSPRQSGATHEPKGLIDGVLGKFVGGSLRHRVDVAQLEPVPYGPRGMRALADLRKWVQRQTDRTPEK